MSAQPLALRLPPYGRAVASALDSGDFTGKIGASPDGSAATMFVVCGSDAWHIARDAWNRALLLVAPPGEDPARFRWDLLAGHEPIMLMRAGDIDGDDLLLLVETLLSDGVERIIDTGTGTHHVRGRTS